MKIRVCDLCEKRMPKLNLKYKYRAKKFWESWYECGWYKIEVCQMCLDKIIKKAEKMQKEGTDK